MFGTDRRRDSLNYKPDWYPGDCVWDRTSWQEATVIEQTLDYKKQYPEYVWSLVKLKYTDGSTALVNSWQLSRTVR